MPLGARKGPSEHPVPFREMLPSTNAVHLACGMGVPPMSLTGKMPVPHVLKR
jgi:hypothetical protein